MCRMCGPSQLAFLCSYLSSLDSIGIAGFSHDFKTLEGQESAIANVFDALGRQKPTFFQMIQFMLAATFPIVWRLPTAKAGLLGEFSSAAGAISESLLAKTRSEKVDEGKGDRSVMGLLSKPKRSYCNAVADHHWASVKASDNNSELSVTDEEVLAQMKVLIVAGE